MYQTHKTYIKPDMRMSDLILENPSLLIMMEHFNLDIVVHDKSVAQICNENHINKDLFTSIANLYNGFNPIVIDNYDNADIGLIITFLRNSHQFYLIDIIPEICGFIDDLYLKTNAAEIKLIERFFAEYTGEIEEHLDYEDNIAFPYFHELLKRPDNPGKRRKDFSLQEYREHHTDIETKLADLKNLLLKYITLKIDRTLKRKLLFSLFDLDFDLKIHSVIEELILMPLIQRIEKKYSIE